MSKCVCSAARIWRRRRRATPLRPGRILRLPHRRLRRPRPSSPRRRGRARRATPRAHAAPARNSSTATAVSERSGDPPAAQSPHYIDLTAPKARRNLPRPIVRGLPLRRPTASHRATLPFRQAKQPSTRSIPMTFPSSPSPPSYRRLRVATLAASAALMLVFAPLAGAQQTQQPASPASVALPSFAPIVKKVMPAVVNISVTEKAGQGTIIEDQDSDQDQGMGPDNQNPQQAFPPSPFDEFLRRFFQQEQRQGGRQTPIPQGHRLALGSGFIIDPAGYIVTNNHVVENADKVTVIF